MTPHTILARAARLGGALLTLLVASQASADVPYPKPVNKCDCGPIDVAFVVDDTGSMGNALNAFKAGFPNLVSQIQAASNGDYRMGLITFKDNVTVREALNPSNNAVMTGLVNTLTASGGSGGPEASTEALNTAIHNLAVRAGQTGSFTNIWRTGARRFIVLITDNRPGGFDDLYTAGTDDTQAHQLALSAWTNEISIHAVYTPYAPEAVAAGIMQDYATTSRGQYRLTQPNGSDTLQAIQDFMSDCKRTPSDVYIKDDPTDFGTEPSTAPSIYTSPDIKVCTSANGCASSVNPVFGSPNNNVFVTLRNNGPKVPPGPVAGSLYVYYSASGGGALWPNHWTLINVEHGIYMNPNEVREVRLGWANVPAAGHYCLLARWVSQGDPMSFPELIGSNTLNNARQNNNIAWRNVNVVNATPGTSTGGGVIIRDVDGAPVGIDIRPTKPFPGKITVDLGARLFEGWLAGGRRGTGITPVGNTAVVVNPEGGTLLNVVLAKGAAEKIDVAFAVDAGAAPGLNPVTIKQLANDGKTENGGVRWDVNILSLDTPAVAPSLSATRSAQGLVDLAWTHSVHHKLYRVWRLDPAAPTARQLIAEFSGAGALETTALRFTDRESASRTFQYFVESVSGNGTTAASEVLTADATGN